MRIAVTGSIATDHLMSFPGRFSEAILGEHLERISLSFLTETLVVRPGGVAANIALGLAWLGRAPVLVGAAGADFAEHRAALEARGVDTRGVLVAEADFTARFLCTTDRDQNQIASFYPGAMRRAAEIRLADVAARTGDFDLVLVGPNDPEAMLAHTRECRGGGVPFAADPSQQLARMDGPGLRELVGGARYLFTNEYEHALLNEKTGWDDEEVLARVGCWVTTCGPAGVRIQRAPDEPVTVPAVPPEPGSAGDPTGVGDGFRAGFLAGLAAGTGLEDAARVGCALATLVLEADGPQEYQVDQDAFLGRIRAVYGAGAAAQIAARVFPAVGPAAGLAS